MGESNILTDFDSPAAKNPFVALCAAQSFWVLSHFGCYTTQQPTSFPKSTVVLLRLSLFKGAYMAAVLVELRRRKNSCFRIAFSSPVQRLV